jgi:hypothetical protein
MYECSGVRAWCIECISEKGRLRRLKVIALINKLKEGGCATCGIKDTRVLDLAHITREGKYTNKHGITVNPSNLTYSALLKEAPKLKVLCAIHHRLETAEECKSENNTPGLVAKKLLLRNEKLKRGGCVDCGLQVICTDQCDNTMAFDFDHINRDEKINHLSDMVYKSSDEEIINEMPKCVIRDTNCHRIKTYMFDRNVGKIVPRISVIDHYNKYIAGERYVRRDESEDSEFDDEAEEDLSQDLTNLAI